MNPAILFVTLNCICFQNSIAREKIEAFLKKGILTKLFASFSRDDCDGEVKPRYVQDNLKLESALILPLIIEKGAVIYICG